MTSITQTCHQNPNHQFVITDDDQKFYKKMGVPLPTLCPDCRVQRRMSFRNFRKLYNRKCDLTGKQIISMYAPDPPEGHTGPPYNVYDLETWWSDQWDACDYAMLYDFHRSFFDQMGELMNKVPRFAVHNTNAENCRYSNLVMKSKNCYLIFGCVRDEDCYYGHIVWDSKNCVDCLYVLQCELCYECVDCLHCYNVKYSKDTEHCFDCAFLLDCKNCNNCFGCVGLREKQYHIFNQPYSKEEYVKRVSTFDFCNKQQMDIVRQKVQELSKSHSFLYMHGTNMENCVGDYIYNSKNVHYGFDVKQSEDIKYAYTIFAFTDSQDVNFSGSHAELAYDSITVEGVNIRFSHLCLNNCHNITYCDCCYGCKNCFGCTGLRNKSYCILNKQYAKEAYEDMIVQIIDHMKTTGEWGEFFPLSISPFGYNETIASEYFPLSKNQVISLGGRWREEKFETVYQGIDVQIPENIMNVDDDICTKILKCEIMGTHYKIIPQELAFYRKMKLPVPRQCFEARHKARMLLKNPRTLWDRKCMKCGIDIKTSYSPDRKEIVYCERCYNETIY